MNTEIIDVGDSVVCDSCNEDFSNSDESGGFLFGSMAYCPHCEVGAREDIRRYNEEQFITGECPVTMSFRDWVLQLRGGDNTIKIITQ